MTPDEMNAAMAEARKKLTSKQHIQYAQYLCDILNLDEDYYVDRVEHNDRIYHCNSSVVFDIADADAFYHAKAFLKTIGVIKNE